ncbi:19076_t:CDS:10 [Racocetra fulgida]|uniref:19076_t:CDS:1 n=1 Tax=Racocetra fulgida TaxID=60492 RepID=A0A9N8VXH4_9GLOM|nr:19076_t:CDS:10 [Racocetra fulgida]
MVKVKNILLIGRTGNGKSTLANVLTGTNDFTESADSTSETRTIKTREFEIRLDEAGNENAKYCVIDTVGVGDTQLDTKAVLLRLGEIAHFIERDGLNQIFFITSGRFTKEEVEAYKLLSSIIFDQQVFNYTTIVRTSFPAFEDDNACNRDREKLRNEGGELSRIFNQAGTKIIYVNNPPLLGRASAIAVNKETREESGKRLIAYLGTISHKNYKPTNLATLNERINSYMSEKEKLEEELKEKEKMMKEAQETYDKKINEIQADLDKKIKEAETKKDEEIRRLENNLNAEIKRLEREEQKTSSKDENAEKIKNLENQLTNLQNQKKLSEEKIAEEVAKQIQKNTPQTPQAQIVQQQPPRSNLVSGTAVGALAGAEVGSIVPGIGTAIGATVGAVVGFIRDESHSYKSNSDSNQDKELKKELKDKLRKLEGKLNKKNDLTKTEKQKLTSEIKGLEQQLTNLDNPSNPNDKPVNPEDPNKTPLQTPPPTPTITEEEAKKKLLEEFSKLFKETPETLESNLLHFAHRVDYGEEKKLSPKELANKLKMEIEKNKKDLYSSLPKTSAEIQQGIEISNYRNSLIFTVFFLPRNDAWEKREEIKEKEIDNSDNEKIESDLEEIKKIIEEEYNIELKNESMKKQEFISHLKTLLESCSVSFDFPKGRGIVVKEKKHEEEGTDNSLQNHYENLEKAKENYKKEKALRKGRLIKEENLWIVEEKLETLENSIQRDKGEMVFLEKKVSSEEEKMEVIVETLNQEKESKIKSILLIGSTGNGKSTLANVLLNKNNNFEEVFKESADSVSETRNIQVEKTEINLDNDGNEKIELTIIDTVGIGDTKLTTQGVLYRLAEASIHIKKGLAQVFFVTSGRFTEKEEEAYRLLSSVIFDDEIVNYTTIVRTNFPEFESEEACKRDRKKLRNENITLANIAKSVKIIHVDNPPMAGRASAIALAKEIREVSHKILITHLGTLQDIYKPRNLRKLNDRIKNYRQIDSLRDQNRSASYTIDQLRRQANENDEVSSALSAFYGLSEVQGTDFSSKSLADEEGKERRRAQEAESKAEEKVERLEARIEQLGPIGIMGRVVKHGNAVPSHHKNVCSSEELGDG